MSTPLILSFLTSGHPIMFSRESREHVQHVENILLLLFYLWAVILLLFYTDRRRRGDGVRFTPLL